MTTQGSHDAKEAALARVIEFHLPNTALPFPEPILGQSSRSQFYASQLLDAYQAPLMKFGLGPSVEEWERVIRAAREFKAAIIDLRNDGIREIAMQAPEAWRSEYPLGHEAYYVAEMVEKASLVMQGKRRKSPKAGRRRNWAAAAIAKVAREIWADAEWSDNPDIYGPKRLNALAIFLLPEEEQAHAWEQSRRYSAHCENFSPRADKEGCPGPFGRFLEAVLAFLGVQGSAASALRSLQDARRKHQTR